MVFHQALHHIAMDKDTASTEFGRILIAAGEGPEQNDFFHIEVLHHVIAQAKQVLRPHGRIVIVSPKWPGMYRDGKPLLMGWNFDDMLRDNDFVGVEIFEGENRFMVTAIAPQSEAKMVKASDLAVRIPTQNFGERKTLSKRNPWG